MRLEDVRRLVRLVEESEIDELDVWHWWGRVRVRKTPEGTFATVPGTASREAVIPAPSGPAAAPEPRAEIGEAEDPGLTPIQSPMVGTFYRAPAPDAEPYVSVGTRVEPGQTVCIIEAMKLMNEIQSEVRGKIARVMVENADPVEFGQTLFLIEDS